MPFLMSTPDRNMYTALIRALFYLLFMSTTGCLPLSLYDFDASAVYILPAYMLVSLPVWNQE